MVLDSSSSKTSTITNTNTSTNSNTNSSSNTNANTNSSSSSNSGSNFTSIPNYNNKGTRILYSTIISGAYESSEIAEVMKGEIDGKVNIHVKI